MSRLYSFVLPAYKARFFREAVDSILAQTYRNFELIIVNDASPEDLDSIVMSYDDPRIKYYVNKENVGGKDLISQWNNSIKFANGEYLILASDDDVYHTEYLAKMDTLVEKYPEVNLLRPRTQHIDSRGRIIEVNGWLAEMSSPLEFAYFKNRAGKGLQFYVFKRKVLMDIGGFINYPLAWYSDDATLIRMSSNGVAFYDEILFSFRFSGESISTKCDNFSSLRLKLIATISYHHDLPQLINDLGEWDTIDLWYRKTIISSLQRIMKFELRYWLGCSTKIAVIRCMPLLIRTKIFSVLEIIRIFFRNVILG